MNIGLTLIFKEKESKIISGILKSLVLDVEIEDFRREVRKLGKKIAEHYNYTFLGINDVFAVSGNIKKGEILGRTTYYDFDKTSSAKKLRGKLSNILSDIDNEIKKLKCSLIYFCKNHEGEQFTITVLTILENQAEKVELCAYNLGNDSIFKNKIINISRDNLVSLDFIGIESVETIESNDLEFSIFETLYSDFETLELLKNEVISEQDLDMELKDVFLI